MVFSLICPSARGTLTRDASVMMVEKVAEIGEESSFPLVTTSTNSVLTVAVSVLLAICDKRGWSSWKSSYSFGKGVVSVRSWWSFLSGYICVRVFVSVFFVLYCPIGRDPFCVRVGIDLCTPEACFRHWRKLIWFPMSLLWSDILSISHSIGILFLFFDVWG